MGTIGRVDWPPDPDRYPSYMRSRIRRGFGLGTGASYKPWLRVRDVGSYGTSGILKSVATGRCMHTLSELEQILFFLLERRAEVVDVREQWPILDLPRTIELTAEFGARHPRDGKFLEPFTIDFMVTERVGDQLITHAESVKTPEDALKESKRRNLRVESEWCSENGLEWKLIATEKFSPQVLSNLRFMRGWFRQRMRCPARDGIEVRRFSDTFLRLYEPSKLLSDLLVEAASALRLSAARADNLFRYCAWVDSIRLDLRAELSMDSPVALRE